MRATVMRGEEFDWAAHIEAVARRLCGEPNARLSSREELRFGTKGSLLVTVAGEHRGTWHSFEAPETGGGVIDLIRFKLGMSNGAALGWLKNEMNIEMPDSKVSRLGRLVASYDYRDEYGVLLYQACRYEPKDFRQRRPREGGGWDWSVKGVRQVPYHLPELAIDLERVAWVVEGEKDADALMNIGLLGTCNAGGAGKWREEFSQYFRGRSIIVLPDNDDPGRDHARDVVRNLLPVASEVRVIELPGLPSKGDVSDWLAAGGTRDQLLALVGSVEPISEMPSGGQEHDDNRPVIRINADALHETASLAERALLASGLPLYTRSGTIVRPAIDDVEAARGRRTKVARLVKIPLANMVDMLARAAHFERWESRTKSWVAVAPPEQIASMVLARDGEWILPPISGVITTPTLRPNGSLLMTEGYDPETRLLLLSPPRLPPVILHPTRDDALRALALLLDLLSEFCFVDDASRAVALSGFITPVIRGAISVAPLHAARAPTPGSGKSYLADIAAAIAIGQRAPAMSAGYTAEELEKRLAAALLSGVSIISLDNVNGELGGTRSVRW
jgi:putative DNA primase/helicase